MKITFNDKSYIECKKSDKPAHITIVIAAADSENPRRKITNAVEITVEEFKKLISDIQ